jgi:thioredoxin-related protein
MKTSLLLATFLTVISCGALADAPEMQTDMRKTLTAASKDQKMAFILLGRPTCGNCNATKAMIKEGKIPVTAADYVMADLNIDDPKTEGEFMRKYGKENFGSTLPFVVVTDSHGKLLASSGGYKAADKWTAILAEAKTKAAAKTGAAGAAPGNWPFKTNPPQ